MANKNDPLTPEKINRADHEEYLSEYLRRKYPKEQKVLMALHQKIYDNLNIDESTEHQKWILLSLSFSNLFSYGEDNKINFTEFQSNKVIGIVGRNHTGKSAILDILLFALFGKCSRCNENEVLNVSKTNMECKVTFSIGPDIYYIRRSSAVPLKFGKIVNKEEVKIKGIKTKTEMQKKINELIGSYDDYIRTCMSLQHQPHDKTTEFAVMTPANKAPLLHQLLGIDVFEKCQEYVKKELTDINRDTNAANVCLMGIGHVSEEKVLELEEEIKILQRDCQKEELFLRTVHRLVIEYESLREPEFPEWIIRKYHMNPTDTLEKIMLLVRDSEWIDKEIDLRYLVDYKTNKMIYDQKKASYPEQRSLMEMREKQLKSTREKLIEKQISLGGIMTHLKIYNEQKMKFDRLEKQKKLYKLYDNIVSPNGVVSVLLRNVIPEVKTNINQVINKIADFSIIVQVGKSVNLLLQKEGQEPYPVSLASGFERFVVGLAMRIVLSKTATCAKPDLFVIDEGWTCLDNNKLGNLDNLMEFIRSQFHQVIMINHLEELKNKFDGQIRVSTNNKISYVKCDVSTKNKINYVTCD